MYNYIGWKKMKKFFSSNLKYLREQKKWSKSKLGELVGVNQTTIGRRENEIINEGSLYKLIKIADMIDNLNTKNED